MQSIAISVFVCLSVSVCPLAWAHLKNHMSTTLSVRVNCHRGWVLLWPHCNTLCTSGFVGDVMISHNGANEPGSKTTWRYIWWSSPDGGTGGEVAMYECRLVIVSAGWITCSQTQNFVIAGRMKRALGLPDSPATRRCRCQYHARIENVLKCNFSYSRRTVAYLTLRCADVWSVGDSYSVLVSTYLVTLPLVLRYSNHCSMLVSMLVRLTLRLAIACYSQRKVVATCYSPCVASPARKLTGEA